ncbi:phosphonate C-P lyase system protein PhnH [Aureimonas sp. AU12]|uniref:phosphonate C-P lyase system protein PhnH n=1 Tax=Aureimonas sp. AU12 TaxID=1638161 RepID=UPI000780A195|nr:phosphonate C-P lyase system protein PhnH [Aureimonas sp. AU12]
MSLDAAAVAGGLADPVMGSQGIFRALMTAMAEPGTIAEFGALVAAPAALAPAAAAILAALADPDTPVWLEEADEAAHRWLRFQTGAPIAQTPAGATFAVLSPGSSPARWRDFAVGTQEYPDRSATLILPVAWLEGGPPLDLAGPGIETRRTIAPSGLPVGFHEAMTANRRGFPLGFDLVLVAGSRAIALPRTTRIEEA